MIWRLALVLLLSAGAARADMVTLPAPQSLSDPRAAHVLAMTQAALDRTTARYGPANAVFAETAANRKRVRRALLRGQLTAAVLPATEEYDTLFLPVRFPMHLGLLGLRVSLIREADQPLFDRIETLDDFRTVTAGLGDGWGVTDVFVDNDLPVVVSSNYEALFRMLGAGRFDHFSRGVSEIRPEFDRWGPQIDGLAIEEGLLIASPLVLILYVAPASPEIAERLRAGFRELFDDGTFETSVAALYGEDIRALNLANRRVLRLDAPLPESADAFDPMVFVARYAKGQ